MTDEISDPSLHGTRAFAPVSDYAGRRNSKTLLIVHQDGSISERVSLQVADASHRELLIFIHFLRHMGRCLIDEETACTVVSRDDPWDFGVELGTGERFFVEITAIADSSYEFEKDKREERLAHFSRSPTIRLRDLKKIADMFPGIGGSAALEDHSSADLAQVIDNPLYAEEARLITGRVDRPSETLSNQIREAVRRKTNKRHEGKTNTVLILDYRGNFYDAEDVFTALNELATELPQTPFPEIWLYVGFFSDDDGDNAEFSFTPLKLTDAKWDRLARFAEERGIDAHGRVIW